MWQARKNLRFALSLQDVPVRDLAGLREHFEEERILDYYTNGELTRWLRQRGHIEEGERISAIVSTCPEEIMQEIYEILSIPSAKQSLHKLKNHLEQAKVIQETQRILECSFTGIHTLETYVRKFVSSLEEFLDKQLEDEDLSRGGWESNLDGINTLILSTQDVMQTAKQLMRTSLTNVEKLVLLKDKIVSTSEQFQTICSQIYEFLAQFERVLAQVEKADHLLKEMQQLQERWKEEVKEVSAFQQSPHYKLRERGGGYFDSLVQLFERKS